MRWTGARGTRPLVLAAMTIWTAACGDAADTSPGGPVTRRVDVGGYTLEATRWPGEGSTVVFLAGLGEPRDTWRGVPEAVAGFAGVVTYDRGGVGASDAAPGARSSDAVAEELDRLLAGLGVPAPYVLAAHSVGAMHMQRYAQRFPQKVAGLVFVDGTPAVSILPIRDAVPTGMTLDELLALTADQLGLTGGARGEFLAQVTSAEQVVNGGTLPDVPVFVLTSMRVEEGGSAEERQAWFALHAEWAAQVQEATHLGLPNAGHHIHWDAPATVVEAVRAVR